MKIFVDENIPVMTVRELRNMGHDVVDIRGTELEGITDEEILKVVEKEKRLLVTTDRGFIRSRHEKNYGILIVRLKQPNRLKIHHKVIKAIKLFKEEEWSGLAVVMQDVLHSVWKAKRKK